MAATSSTQKEACASLKLLVNKETNKVLFAEAGKDFVDVLCSFLTLPLGTIARLVQKESSIGKVTVGCLNALYQSVEDLKEENFVIRKELLLQPLESCCRALKLNIDDTEPKKFYICPDKCNYHRLSTSDDQKCECGNRLTCRVYMKHFREGFVKGDVAFIITDDLTVMLDSIAHTSLGLLQSSGVKSTNSIKEMIVIVTKEKVLDLLKCSLLSKSTLTDCFLRKKPILEMLRFSPCGIQSDIRNVRICVKLIIRKSDGKILYAHGEKDFADFLLSFLTLPLAVVLRALGGDCCVGSFYGLYSSISNLSDCLMSHEVRGSLTYPCLASHVKLRKHMLPYYMPQCYYYQCKRFKKSCIRNTFCITEDHKDCCVNMSLVNLEIPQSYVKGGATYVATDELVV